jgi:hypothetical protein
MIEPLPIAFKARERIYRQLARKGIVALYEVRNFRHILIGFELIIIRYQKARNRNTWRYPECERYPTDEEFGHYAWSFPLAAREITELAFDHLAATMACNRSERSTPSDFYRAWSKASDRLDFRRWLAPLSTGRPLPKTNHRPALPWLATEVISEQKCHKLTTNEDSPRRKS